MDNFRVKGDVVDGFSPSYADYAFRSSFFWVMKFEEIEGFWILLK